VSARTGHRHDEQVRFHVSQTLDAVERRLSTDPLLASAVLDLGEVVRLAEVDHGRPANLLRLGLAVDALARETGDDTATVYPVAERGLLSDTDLTSNERMVIRRWSDDGLVEVIPAGGPVAARVREIGELTGLPVIGRAPLPGYAGPGYALLPAAGGAALARHPSGGPGSGVSELPAPGTHPALRRWWRCPEPDCPSFGPPDRTQPPPRLAAGVPSCPRHGTRLADAGPRPAAVALAVRVNGVVRHRFPVQAGRPVTVGRLPDDPDGVTLGPLVDRETGSRISRTHVRFELGDGGLTVTDLSTNGTWLRGRQVPPQQPVPVGERDTVHLHDRVEIGRAGQPSAARPGGSVGSVMGDAPTMALRLPRTPGRE
jgi:FHA domain